MKIKSIKSMLGKNVVPLTYDKLKQIYNDDYVYVRIPLIFNQLSNYSFKDDTFVYFKTKIEPETIIDLIMDMDFRSSFLDEVRDQEILNINIKPNHMFKKYKYNRYEEDERNDLNLNLEFFKYNSKQKEVSEKIIKDIHDEIKYIRGNYTKVFTLKKRKTNSDIRSIISIKNLYDEEQLSILRVISELGDDYVRKSTIFNILTYALMMTNNLDFINEEEYTKICKLEKIKKGFI
ncbi:hypothetical protein [Staphylococcus phage vB_StaM_SA1]|nr:hypothetical protein [Staphylococcus phage vB_StaM_SA1]